MWNSLTACALTVVLETGFFLAAGYRNRMFLLLCACVNTATNLSLNLLLTLLFSRGIRLTLLIYPLEAMVIAAEFLVFGCYLGRSRKLFWLTVAANVLSYGAGILLYGHL